VARRVSRVEGVRVRERLERETGPRAGFGERAIGLEYREAVVVGIAVQVGEGVDEQAFGAAECRRLREHEHAGARHGTPR
jgi:hypothetical protein